MVAGLPGAPAFLTVLQFSCFMLHAPAMPFRAGETIILQNESSVIAVFFSALWFLSFLLLDSIRY